jgi:Sulfotransferase domain
MLPSFLLIGAMKSGTTTLWWYLREHPEVFLATPKEPNFFNDHWHRGVGWYERLFDRAGTAQARGEASVRYTSWPDDPECPGRIASVVPDARLLYVVREPIARMRSHYLHEVAALRERRPVEQALRENPIYLDRSRYATQLERYLDHFPREQLLVVRAEELFRDPSGVLPGVYGFLGVDPSFRPADPGRRDNETAQRFQLPVVVRRGIGLAVRAGVYRHVPQRAKDVVRTLTRQRSRTAPEVRVPEQLAAELRALLADELRRLDAIAGDRLFPEPGPDHRAGAG